MSDELKPVAWAYEYRGHGDVDTRPGTMDITRSRTTHRLAKSWTEIPLYAIDPEALARKVLEAAADAIGTYTLEAAAARFRVLALDPAEILETK